jgi:hypothetical protein
LIKTISTLVLLAAVLFSQNALAAQYEVFVTGSTHISPSQSALGSIVQKQILVDTDANEVTIELANLCMVARMCPQMISDVTFKITEFSEANGAVTSLRASGQLMLNNKPTDASIEMNLDANNAMNITITNSSDCKSMESTFVGSPSTPAVF